MPSRTLFHERSGSTIATINDPVTPTSVARVLAASVAPVATDPAMVVAISPNSAALAQTVAGAKTHNNAAPGATNVGALEALATVARPALTEGNLVLLSADLSGGQRSVNMPYAHGALGHYRTTHRCALVATQAAGSRLFVLRNNAANTIIVTRFHVKWIQTGAHTAVLEDSLDLTRLTGFTVLDTTNTVTPTATVKRTAGMAAAPGGAQIRGVTVAGAAAGMTGGTSTPDGNTLGQMPMIFQLVLTTATNVPFVDLDYFANDTIGIHPLALAQNEGIALTNRVVFGAAGTASVYVDCSWAEVAGF